MVVRATQRRDSRHIQIIANVNVFLSSEKSLEKGRKEHSWLLYTYIYIFVFCFCFCFFRPLCLDDDSNDQKMLAYRKRNLFLAWKTNAEWLPLYVIWRLVCGANTRRGFEIPLTTFFFLFFPLATRSLLLQLYSNASGISPQTERVGIFFFWGSQKANRKYRSISLRKNLPFCFVSFTTCCRLSLSLLMTLFFLLPFDFFVFVFCLLDYTWDCAIFHPLVSGEGHLPELNQIPRFISFKGLNLLDEEELQQ